MTPGGFAPMRRLPPATMYGRAFGTFPMHLDGGNQQFDDARFASGTPTRGVVAVRRTAYPTCRRHVRTWSRWVGAVDTASREIRRRGPAWTRHGASLPANQAITAQCIPEEGCVARVSWWPRSIASDGWLMSTVIGVSYPNIIHETHHEPKRQKNNPRNLHL